MRGGSASGLLKNVLFIVVACTRDPSREAAFRRLIRSLNKQHHRVGFDDNLLLFDNDSTIRSPYEKWRVPAIFAMSAENVGYWSALKWSMDHASELFGRTFDYVHPIESDLVLYRLERLAEAVAFLDGKTDIETVRTQEFSVAQKNRYFKGRRNLLACRRSWVADYNAITKETVVFEESPDFENIFLANWHAKVPALHRMASLKSIFGELAELDELTEFDFMKAAYERSKRVAVLDRGIYYTVSYRPSRSQVSGSFTDLEALKKMGYRQSRYDRISRDFGEIQIERSPVFQ